MKNKLISKIFVLFICSIFFVSAIVAQEEPQALKIDEYSDETGSLQTLQAQADRFAERLKDESATTKGFIAYFDGDSFLKRDRSRYGAVYGILRTLAARNKNRISEENGLQMGGRSMNRSKFARVEFWLVPQNAETPDIRANECSLCGCPTIEVQSGDFADVRRKLTTFTVNVSGWGGDSIEYEWKVSAGAIVEGQGTPTIKVDAAGAAEITATVEIDGVCEECVREATRTIKIQ